MGFSDHRGPNMVRRDHDCAIGCPTSHLNTVYRKVSDMFTFYHGRICEKISNDHDSLPSKSSDNKVVIESIVFHIRKAKCRYPSVKWILKTQVKVQAKV